MSTKSIALNVLHTHSDEKVSHSYKSEFKKIREKQVLLMINNNECKNNII